jgi:serine/threonine protein kinase
VKTYQYKNLSDVVWGTFVTETKALAQLHKHPNIVFCEGIAIEPQLAVVMEWVEYDLYVTLKESLLDLRPHHFQIIKGIASACDAIHRGSLLHRDLKPNNILINSKFEPKLCDFGLVVSLEDHPSLAGDKKGSSSLLSAPPPRFFTLFYCLAPFPSPLSSQERVVGRPQRLWEGLIIVTLLMYFHLGCVCGL